jgi:hypothetical protein
MDGSGQLIDNEGEVGWTPQKALEIGEPPSARRSRTLTPDALGQISTKLGKASGGRP